MVWRGGRNYRGPKPEQRASASTQHPCHANSTANQAEQTTKLFPGFRCSFTPFHVCSCAGQIAWLSLIKIREQPECHKQSPSPATPEGQGPQAIRCLCKSERGEQRNPTPTPTPRPWPCTSVRSLLPQPTMCFLFASGSSTRRLLLTHFCTESPALHGTHLLPPRLTEMCGQQQKAVPGESSAKNPSHTWGSPNLQGRPKTQVVFRTL